MPELPEVESVRRGVERAALGWRISAVDVRRKDIVEDAPRGRADLEQALLLGAVLDRTERRGKQLVIVARDGRALRVHLGMTGSLSVERSRTGPLRPHTHVVWTLERGKHTAEMMFVDPRRFGSLRPLADVSKLADLWRDLGPDALTITGVQLAEAFEARSIAIKPALLNQHLVAGVGNIYADESLFDARIHPRRPAGSLTRSECENLASSIRRILCSAVERGGSTIRDYRNAEGGSGSFQHSHNVYGKGGRPCPRCGMPLRSIVLAQRTTVFCPRCQARKPSS